MFHHVAVKGIIWKYLTKMFFCDDKRHFSQRLLGLLVADLAVGVFFFAAFFFSCLGLWCLERKFISCNHERATILSCEGRVYCIPWATFLSCAALPEAKESTVAQFWRALALPLLLFSGRGHSLSLRTAEQSSSPFSLFYSVLRIKK